MGVQQNIRTLRDLTGISQQDLADIAGVSRGAVSLWEIGNTEPRMGAVQAIADYFGITKSSIIEEGGMDNMAISIGGRLVEIKPELDLSSDEVELVRLYRAANRQGRESIMAIARVSSGVERQSQDNRVVNE